MNNLISRQALCEYALNQKDKSVTPNDIMRFPSAQSEQSTDIQDILQYLDNVIHPLVSPENWNVYSELHDMISNLPSVQPEIVRCKDCMYADEDGVCQNSKGLAIQDDYDFCSYAERRTDGN